jgi:hypothetical protein
LPTDQFQHILALSPPLGTLHFHRLTATKTTPDNPPSFSLEGEISPFDNNFSAAHQQVQRLVQQLQGQFPGQPVQVIRWPTDTSTHSELEGEFGHSQLTARFQIEIGSPIQAESPR